MLYPKCIYRKSISAKCTRLACLLSLASLFLILMIVLVMTIMVNIMISGKDYDNDDGATKRQIGAEELCGGTAMCQK